MFIARYKDLLDLDAIRGIVKSGGDLSRQKREFADLFREKFDAAAVFLYSTRGGALRSLLDAYDIRNKAEVVIPSLTQSVLADAVLNCGGVPHLVDIEPSILAMKSSSLGRVLAKGRSKLVMDMPLLGVPYNDEPIAQLCRKANVPYVVDLTQSWFSGSDDIPPAQNASAINIGLFSGNPLVSTGGGVLIIRDENIARKIRLSSKEVVTTLYDKELKRLAGLLLQNRLLQKDIYPANGLENDAGQKYVSQMSVKFDINEFFDKDFITSIAKQALNEFDRLGNMETEGGIRRFYRWLHPSRTVPKIQVELMGDLSAAVALSNFGLLEEEKRRRRTLLNQLNTELVGIGQSVEVNWQSDVGAPMPLYYPLFIEADRSRTRLISNCARAGFEVGSFIYPRPLSGMFPYYKLCRHTARYLRGAWRVASSIVNLPLHSDITPMYAVRMVRALRSF